MATIPALDLFEDGTCTVQKHLSNLNKNTGGSRFKNTGKYKIDTGVSRDTHGTARAPEGTFMSSQVKSLFLFMKRDTQVNV